VTVFSLLVTAITTSIRAPPFTRLCRWCPDNAFPGLEATHTLIRTLSSKQHKVKMLVGLFRIVSGLRNSRAEPHARRAQNPRASKFVFKSSLVVLVMLVFVFNGYTHLNVQMVNAQATTGSPQYVYYNSSDTKLDESYRAQSVMLSNPEINAWLTHNHIHKSLLLPYVTMIPVGGNPYDYSQGSVTINSTTYAIYSYELPNGTVISFWVLGNNMVRAYTYQSTPNVVFSVGGSS